MTNIEKNLVSLQTDLGYHFNNQALLTRALTHRSCGEENNERLEYLGDSILGFVIAEGLFERFPGGGEGELTQMRAQLVCNENLAVRGRGLALQRCLLLGGSALKSGGGENDSIIADAFEAVIGAIYLDSDLATVKKILLKLFEPHLAEVSPFSPKDDKTRLQEHQQKRALPLPLYEVVEQSGKPHQPDFTVACRVSGLPEAVTATGGSRRAAEQDAARKALSMLEAPG